MYLYKQGQPVEVDTVFNKAHQSGFSKNEVHQLLQTIGDVDIGLYAVQDTRSSPYRRMIALYKMSAEEIKQKKEDIAWFDRL